MVLEALQGYLIELIQGVGSTFGVMISYTVVSLSWILNSSFASMRNMHLQCCTSRIFGIKCDGVLS